MRVLLAVLGIVLSVVACAEDSATYEEGKHYQKLAEAVRTDDPDKIEVREVFAYTCGHCFRFAPLFSDWKDDQADDVNVVLTPVVWAQQMEPYARAFYTARALGILDEAHMDLFNAIHGQRTRFGSAEDFAAFYSQYDGVDQDKFVKTYESFGVSSQVRQGDAKTRAYNIKGTPELIVDGEYRIATKIDPSSPQSHEDMLKVADYLVNRIREGDRP